MKKHISFTLFGFLLPGFVGTAHGLDQPVLLCNQTTGASHLIGSIWDIQDFGDGIATEAYFEGTYHENGKAARVTGLFVDEVLMPYRQLKFDVVYADQNACSWTYDGIKYRGTDEYIGTWTHTAPQNCGGSGGYTFVWDVCPVIQP